MPHGSYQQKTRKSHTLRTAFLLVGSIGTGGFLFWYGLHAFRSSAAQNQQQAAQSQSVQDSEDSLLDLAQVTLLNDTISLFSAYDGQATGRVTRTFGQGTATFDILAYLPVIDRAAYAYEIWAIKDGLADVVSLGELAPRADGSWAATILAGPAAGMADPHDYTTLVIMQEPRDENAAPSGVKIAQGAWRKK